MPDWKAGLHGFLAYFLLALLGVSPINNAASAQTVSPGPLSKSHTELEGIKNCTQCHEMGKRVIDSARCLVCHVALQSRIRAGRGYHGSADVAGLPCENCHHEHVGRDVPLIVWKGSQAAFDHERAGWPLTGAHSKAKCDDCHDPRRVSDPEVRDQLSRAPSARTFLGLDRSCVTCHFDEHRGQLSRDCSTCHDTDAWKPVPRFDHDRAGYPLRGRHRDVPCARCHRIVRDPAFSSEASPRPRSDDYMAVKPLGHAECSSCHADPHAGRLGGACGSCHTVESWAQTSGRGSAGGFDHARTRYPLLGKHRDAPCGGCHPDSKSGRAGETVLTGFPFGECTDCHEDAHAGQITGPLDCSRCHTVDGFRPARFTLTAHVGTRYRLTGAHGAVPCISCHPVDPTLQKPVSRNPPRVRITDPSRYSYAGRDIEDCAVCHTDPHAGQFAVATSAHASRKCADCHRTTTFHDLEFDHDRDTSYPLRGRHAKVSCAVCHADSRSNGTTVARYRGSPTECDGCHADPHLGQFASPSDRRLRCADCHTEEAFSPAGRFDHARTRFPLTGSHKNVKCPECHRAVAVLPRQSAALFRPLETACAGCHEDPHRGAFTRSNAATSSCEGCHTTSSWARVSFDHDRTGFRLGAAHAGVPCSSCHPGADAARPSRDCAGCHVDPHGGALGSACGGCHLDTPGFRDAGAARFHETTRLPLLGRHAAIPCASCHADRYSATSFALDPRCVSCHEADYERTGAPGIDHRAWGFSTRCEECHTSFRWDLAAFPIHERCFPIRSGHHSVPCLDCHTSFPAQQPSGCATMTAACTRCHGCAEHPNVPGFECRDRKCFECHPDGGSD
jgi:hypothetical protein